MNLQDYISSGIIESYVLGIATLEECLEFQELCEIHPELKQARIDFEYALESRALTNAIQPPPFVKEELFDKIQKEYLYSGLIESYILGIATDKEKLEFEELREKYPELKAAQLEFELALESKALAGASKPPSFLKEQIIQTIQDSSVAKVISIGHKPIRMRPDKKMNWAIAASIVILLGCAAVVYSFYNQNMKLQSEMAKTDEARDKLNERARSLEEEMVNDNPHIKMVNVVTSPTSKASINVFWDSTSTNVYLVVKDLPPLPAGQKYHLWAIAKKKYKSLGLFDAPDNDKLILKMNNVQSADSFTISIEKNPGAMDTTSAGQ